jgi:hypothetical protein
MVKLVGFAEILKSGGTAFTTSVTMAVTVL